MATSYDKIMRFANDKWLITKITLLFTWRHKGDYHHGLLIQLFADKLIGHDDVIDYKLLPIEFVIAYDVVIGLLLSR